LIAAWLALPDWAKKLLTRLGILLLILGIVAGARWHWIGVGEDRCQGAQVEAQAKAVAKGQKAAQKAQEAATAVKIEVRQESENEAVQAREIVRYLPRTCPAQPERLRDIGRDAVEAARASLPAAP
jgi:hypothetical protein